MHFFLVMHFLQIVQIYAFSFYALLKIFKFYAFSFYALSEIFKFYAFFFYAPCQKSSNFMHTPLRSVHKTRVYKKKTLTYFHF